MRPWPHPPRPARGTQLRGGGGGPAPAAGGGPRPGGAVARLLLTEAPSSARGRGQGWGRGRGQSRGRAPSDPPSTDLHRHAIQLSGGAFPRSLGVSSSHLTRMEVWGVQWRTGLAGWPNPPPAPGLANRSLVVAERQPEETRGNAAAGPGPPAGAAFRPPALDPVAQAPPPFSFLSFGTDGCCVT